MRYTTFGATFSEFMIVLVCAKLSIGKREVSIIYVEGDKNKVSRTMKNVMDNEKSHGQ